MGRSAKIRHRRRWRARKYALRHALVFHISELDPILARVYCYEAVYYDVFLKLPECPFLIGGDG